MKQQQIWYYTSKSMYTNSGDSVPHCKHFSYNTRLQRLQPV